MLKCIAVDDEPLALRKIESYLSTMTNVEFIAGCTSAEEAQKVLATNEIDLMFVDINMPKMSGVDFVRSLEVSPLVVFTTAHSEYALEGFKLNAVDYLLKPYSQAEFSSSVERVIELFDLKKRASQEAEEEEILESECVSVKSDYKTMLIRHIDIVYMESEGEYIKIHLNDGSTISTLFRLKNMVAMLPEESFARIHRSYVINLRRVKSYDRSRVYLTTELDLPIGEFYREEFYKILDNFRKTN